MQNLLCAILMLLTLSGNAQRIKPFHGPFPEPSPHKDIMFYLQRTIDRNTVVYKLNIGLDGELNLKEPFRIYWIDFEHGGKIAPLTFIQNKLAYGIEARLLDKQHNTFELNLVSYKKIKMFLRRSAETGQYQVHVDINGKPAILQKVLVNITGGTQLDPTVTYLELTGTALRDGRQVRMRIPASQ